MGHFCNHENQDYHPYLSEIEGLRPAKRKSSIIRCILQERFMRLNESPNISAKIFDDVAVIKKLVSRTFNVLMFLL